MQNWLAAEEPALFFGVLPPARDRLATAHEPFGRIVFTAVLSPGERVRVLHGTNATPPRSPRSTPPPFTNSSEGCVVGVEPSSSPDEPTLYRVRLDGVGDDEIITYHPQELRRATLPSGGPRFEFDSKFRWNARLAGRAWALPSRGVCRSGDVVLFDEPIHFTCPEEEPSDSSFFVVRASIDAVIVALEISFTHVLPMPWDTAKCHWLADGGLVSPHHEPLIREEYKQFTPSHGHGRREESRHLPELFARLTRTPSLPKRLVQSEDGTVTQTCQCAPGDFDAVRSVHRIEAEYRRQDFFVFTIIRCCNERAAGLRVGVCNEDGSQAWMLRVSDARLCGANGLPVSGSKSLNDDLHRFLPPDLMGRTIECKVDMTPHGTSTLSFRVADVGSHFSATRQLPAVVRPCVHLTHKGDAVRLHDHSTLRLRNPTAKLGEATTRSMGKDCADSRYMSGVAAYNRGRAPSPQPYTRSLRNLRPSSPAPSTPRAASPRSRTPQTRRVSSVWQEQDGNSFDPRCAHCRQNNRTAGKPWCVRCSPVHRDFEARERTHEQWSTTGGDAESWEIAGAF